MHLGLRTAAGLAIAGAGTSRGASFPQFFFAQIHYRGGEWDPNPQYVKPMIEELELRTSV